MFIIKYKKLFLALSGILMVVALAAIAVFGLNLGIDFTGGAMMEIEYQEARPEVQEIETAAQTVGLENVTVQPTGETGYILRMRDLAEEEKSALDQALTFEGEYEFTEGRFSSIGPVIGEELAQRGLIAIILVVLLIIAFVAFVFRHVSSTVSSWKYGLVAIVTLVHDIVIPVGIFAALGHYIGFELDALFLTALLAILGLSVNDTIVIFDRIRENIRHKVSIHFDETVGVSLRQTFLRSFNTSFSTLIVLLSLFFLGGETTRDFALVLAVGIALGTYSSIFLAAPLLVTIEKWGRGKA